jgi:hypothetical protein
VFTGFTRDVAAALSAFDLVVFPSLWEGTPLTMFEALAMGKPIVATDADGLLDILTDRKDALVVPKANAGALANAVGRDDSIGPTWPPAWPLKPAPTGAGYDIGAFVRKMERLYELLQRELPANRPSGYPHRGPELPVQRTMTIDQGVASRILDRSLAWRVGAATPPPRSASC